MIVVYNDGSTLECSKIDVSYDALFCDDYRIVAIDDVDHIEDGWREDEEK